MFGKKNLVKAGTRVAVRKQEGGEWKEHVTVNNNLLNPPTKVFETSDKGVCGVFLSKGYFMIIPEADVVGMD